jgi:hypothetical protein
MSQSIHHPRKHCEPEHHKYETEAACQLRIPLAERTAFLRLALLETLYPVVVH